MSDENFVLDIRCDTKLEGFNTFLDLCKMFMSKFNIDRGVIYEEKTLRGFVLQFEKDGDVYDLKKAMFFRVAKNLNLEFHDTKEFGKNIWKVIWFFQRGDHQKWYMPKNDANFRHLLHLS